MRKFILTTALALTPLSAIAADLMPVKAAPPSVLLTYRGNGTYFGLGTFAENDKISAAGTGTLGGLGGTFAVGASINAVGGYMWGDGTSWKAIEVMGSYKNVGVTTVSNTGVPMAFDSRYGFTERLKIGGPVTALLAALPNLGGLFPVLPAAPIGGVGNTHPYLFGALHEDPLRTNIGVAAGRAWIVKGGFGLGLMQQLSSRLTADLWAEYIPAGGSMTVGLPAGVARASVGRETRFGASLLF